MLPYLTTLLPTLVGGLIGFLSALLMAGYQAGRQRRNIAQGILLELEHLQKPLTGWANILRAPPGGGLVRIEAFAFYIRLLNVEQERQTPTDSPVYPIMMEGVGKGLTELVERLPHLRKLLLKEVERSARSTLAGGVRPESTRIEGR